MIQPWLRTLIATIQPFGLSGFIDPYSNINAEMYKVHFNTSVTMLVFFILIVILIISIYIFIPLQVAKLAEMTILEAETNKSVQKQIDTLTIELLNIALGIWITQILLFFCSIAVFVCIIISIVCSCRLFFVK